MLGSLRSLVRFAFDGLAFRLLVLAAAVGAILSLVLLGLPHETGDEPVRTATVRAPVILPVAVPPPTPAIEPKLGEDHSRRWFPSLDLGASRFVFQASQGIAPADLCPLFVDAGWQAGRAFDPSGGDREECAAERVYAASSKAKGTRLFALARGARNQQATALDLRIKFNFYDDKTKGSAADDTASLMQVVLAKAGMPAGDDVRSKIAALEPFELEAAGGVLALRPERGDIPRFNLTLRFPTPFEAAAPGRLLSVSAAQRRVAERSTPFSQLASPDEAGLGGNAVEEAP